MGCGLLIYHPDMHVTIAHWGAEERYQVYTFIALEESNRVLVLTHRGIFVFASDFEIPKSLPIETFVPIYECPKEKEELNNAVIIPRSGNLEQSEVWAASLTGQQLFVLSTLDYNVKEAVTLPKSDKRIRHMRCLTVNEKPVLAVANKGLIYLFDVEERKCMNKHFNCQELFCNPNDTMGKH